MPVAGSVALAEVRCCAGISIRSISRPSESRTITVREPSGLRVELRELVAELAVLGKAVLISSHILAELSELCTGVAVIEAGKIRATGSVGDIMRELSPHTRVFLRCVAGPEAARVALAEIAGVESVRPDGEGVSFQIDGGEDTLARVLAELVRRGVAPTEYAPERANLEDLFLSLTEGVLQ